MFSLVPAPAQTGAEPTPTNCPATASHGRRKKMVCCAGLILTSLSVIPLQSGAEITPQNLELSQAVQLTLRHNPRIQGHEPRLAVLKARTESARQAPPLNRRCGRGHCHPLAYRSA